MLVNSRMSVSNNSQYARGNLVVVFLVACLFLVGCSKMTDVEHIARAKEFSAKGDYRSAIIEYKNALSLNSQNAEVRFALGQVYARTGDIESAKKELLIAYDKGVHQDEVRATLAKLLVSGQKFDELIETVSAYPAKDVATTAKIYTYLGLAHIGSGDRERGVELLEEAKSLAPQSADVLYGLAYLEFLGRNHDKAQALLEQAISVDPSLPDARLLHADIEFFLSNYADAERGYLYVVDQEPNNILTIYALRANLGLIQSLIAQNKLGMAQSRIDTVLAKAPANPFLLYFAGMIAYQEKNYEKAEENLLKVIASIPNHMPSFFLLGAINFQQNELEQAGEYLSTYVARDPSNIQARKILAATRMKLRQPELAMDALSPVLDQAGKDVGLLSLVGSIAVRSGKSDMGTSYLEEAVAAQPENTAIRTELALAYLAESDFSQAIKELETASRDGSGDSGKKATLLLVLTHLRNGDSEAALNEAKNYLALHPDDPTAHNLVGTVYAQMGDAVAARKNFEGALVVDSKYTPATVNLARMAQAEGNFLDARKLYESIISYDPDNVSVIMALSHVDQKLGDIESAVQWLVEAANVSSDALMARVMLAHYYLRISDLSNAKKYIKEVRALAPDSSEAFMLRGLLAKKEGRLDDALKSFNQLLALDPKSLVGLYQSGVIYSVKREYDLAEQALKRVLAAHGEHLPSVSLLARIEMRRGDLTKAKALVERVKSKNAKSFGAYVLEADLFYAQRKYAEAVELYRKAAALNATDSLILKIAKAYRLGGDRDAAKAFLEEWLNKKPDNYQIRLVLAGEQELRGETDDAIKSYETLLSLRSDDPLVLNNLAWLYFQAGNPGARELAEKAYRLEPRDPSILDTLGWILVSTGDLERAVQLLTKAEKLAPNVADIKYHLAVALAKLGEHGQAKSMLTALLKSPEGLSVDTLEVKKLLDSL